MLHIVVAALYAATLWLGLVAALVYFNGPALAVAAFGPLVVSGSSWCCTRWSWWGGCCARWPGGRLTWCGRGGLSSARCSSHSVVT